MIRFRSARDAAGGVNVAAFTPDAFGRKRRPNSLWMNTQLEPYSDPKIRRAMSLVVNRDVINDILYEGAPIATIYPFPLYPNLSAPALNGAF